MEIFLLKEAALYAWFVWEKVLPARLLSGLIDEYLTKGKN